MNDETGTWRQFLHSTKLGLAAGTGLAVTTGAQPVPPVPPGSQPTPTHTKKLEPKAAPLAPSELSQWDLTEHERKSLLISEIKLDETLTRYVAHDVKQYLFPEKALAEHITALEAYLAPPKGAKAKQNRDDLLLAIGRAHQVPPDQIVPVIDSLKRAQKHYQAQDYVKAYHDFEYGYQELYTLLAAHPLPDTEFALNRMPDKVVPVSTRDLGKIGYTLAWRAKSPKTEIASWGVGENPRANDDSVGEKGGLANWLAINPYQAIERHATAYGTVASIGTYAGYSNPKDAVTKTMQGLRRYADVPPAARAGFIQTRLDTLREVSRAIGRNEREMVKRLGAETLVRYDALQKDGWVSPYEMLLDVGQEALNKATSPSPTLPGRTP